MLYVCPLPCRSYISSLFASEIIVEEKKSNGETEEPSTETNAKVRKYMSENEILLVCILCFVFRFFLSEMVNSNEFYIPTFVYLEIPS